jgi:hypothetical protein
VSGWERCRICGALLPDAAERRRVKNAASEDGPQFHQIVETEVGHWRTYADGRAGTATRSRRPRELPRTTAVSAPSLLDAPVRELKPRAATEAPAPAPPPPSKETGKAVVRAFGHTMLVLIALGLGVVAVFGGWWFLVRDSGPSAVAAPAVGPNGSVPDSTWQHLTDDDGHFSVDIPGVATKSIRPSAEDPGRTVSRYQVRGLDFTAEVSFTEFQGAPDPAAVDFPAVVKHEAATQGLTVAQQGVTKPGVYDATFSSTDGTGRMRLVLQANRLYTLVTLTQTGPSDTVQQRMIDTFTVTG